jgi:hypothetical protein
MQSLDPARLVGNYAFCLIYPLFAVARIARLSAGPRRCR